MYDNPLEPVELGASIFVDVNHILYNATRTFGLPLKDPGSDEDGILGIWDGERFVYQQDSRSWGVSNPFVSFYLSFYYSVETWFADSHDLS